MPRLFPQKLSNKLHVLKFLIDVYLLGDILTLGVIVQQEIPPHCGRVVLVVDKEILLIHQPAADILYHREARHTDILRHSHDIVLLLVIKYLLGLGKPRYRRYPVAQPRSLFKLEILRRPLHLLGKHIHRGSAAVFQIIQSLVYYLFVLLRAYFAAAHSHTLFYVMVKAGALLSESGGKALFTGRQHKDRVCLLHRLLYRVPACVGSDIVRVFIVGVERIGNARIRLT